MIIFSNASSLILSMLAHSSILMVMFLNCYLIILFSGRDHVEIADCFFIKLAGCGFMIDVVAR